MPISAFTDEQKRLVNNYYPGLGVIPPNVGSGGLLGIVEEKLDEGLATADLVSGDATVLNTGSSVVVAVGAAYNGKPAWACLVESGDAVAVSSCVISGGNLTITLTGVVTADRSVRYWIDAR